MNHDLELMEYDLEHKGYWVIGLDCDMDIGIIPAPFKTKAKAEKLMIEQDALTYHYGTLKETLVVCEELNKTMEIIQ